MIYQDIDVFIRIRIIDSIQSWNIFDNTSEHFFQAAAEREARENPQSQGQRQYEDNGQYRPQWFPNHSICDSRKFNNY